MKQLEVQRRVCDKLCLETLCKGTDQCDYRHNFNSVLTIYSEGKEEHVSGYCKLAVNT